jgi:hypothetical protein
MRAWIARRGARWVAGPTAAACWCVFDEDERKAWGAGFVAKDADGYCTHLDRGSYLCRVWERRSRVCRGYDCNADFLLQVAVRNPFGTLTELVRLAATAYIPKETYIRVPPRGK